MTDHNPIEGTTALNMLLYMVPMPLFLSAGGGVGGGYAFALRDFLASLGRRARISSMLRPVSLSELAARRHLFPLNSMCVVASSEDTIERISYTPSIVAIMVRTFSKVLLSKKPSSTIRVVVILRCIFVSLITSPSCISTYGSGFKKASLKIVSSARIIAIMALFLFCVVVSSRFLCRYAFKSWAEITPKKPTTPTIAVWKARASSTQVMVSEGNEFSFSIRRLA
jgi:hypothetical protein